MGIESVKPQAQRHPRVLAPSHHAAHAERRTSGGILDDVPTRTAPIPMGSLVGSTIISGSITIPEPHHQVMGGWPGQPQSEIGY